MRRTVLHVIPSVAPRDGGPSAAVLGMGRALRTLGWDAQIATTDADGRTRLPVDLGRTVDHHGVPTIFFARALGVGFKWSPALAQWLRQHVTDYDVVHVHAVFSHSSMAAGRACQAAAVPYLVRPLGTLDPWSLGRKAWRKRLLMAGAGRRLLRGAAAMHYTTDEEGRLAETALRGLPRPIVVPNGVDDEWFQVGPAGANVTPRLLSMSRLDPKKGIDRLIAAFHSIADEPHARAWRLTIAGDGEPSYVSTLRALARDGAGRGRIDFPGWVHGRDKRALLAASALFVLASRQENFGIAAAEALAAGLPVVLSAGVNLAHDVRAAGAGWTAGETTEALADVLSLAMRGGEERRRRGARGRRMAEAFRWPAVAAALVDAYVTAASPDTPTRSAAGVVQSHAETPAHGLS
ncbi:MAG: glycosyltransferase [Acidobacteria bacterium]|nr:glycosyltransferase [Acidobacteriota bacterium]